MRTCKSQKSKRRSKTPRDDREESDRETWKVGDANVDVGEIPTTTERQVDGEESEEEDQDGAEDEKSADEEEDLSDAEVPQALREEDKLVRQLEGIDAVDGGTDKIINGNENENDSDEAVEPASTPPLSEAQQRDQALAAIRTNWNIQHVHEMLTTGTWLTGELKTELADDDTWELATLLDFQRLSEQTKGMSEKMIEQFIRLCNRRKSTGGKLRKGRSREDKEKNLRHDIRTLLKEDWTNSDSGKETTAVAKDGGERSGSKKRKHASLTKQSEGSEPEQEEGDDSSAEGARKRSKRREQQEQPILPESPTRIRTSRQRSQALERIYNNWNITSLLDMFPGRLAGLGATSDADLENAIVAGLLDLSDLTNTAEQAAAVRQAIRNQMEFVSLDVGSMLTLLESVTTILFPRERSESSTPGRLSAQHPVHQTRAEVAASNLRAQLQVDAPRVMVRQPPQLPAAPRALTIAGPTATASELRRALNDLDAREDEVSMLQYRRRLAVLRDSGVSTEVEETQLAVATSLIDRTTAWARLDCLRERFGEVWRGEDNAEQREQRLQDGYVEREGRGDRAGKGNREGSGGDAEGNAGGNGDK